MNVNRDTDRLFEKVNVAPHPHPQGKNCRCQRGDYCGANVNCPPTNTIYFLNSGFSRVMWVPFSKRTRTNTAVFFRTQGQLLMKGSAYVFYIARCLFQQSSRRDDTDEVQEG